MHVELFQDLGHDPASQDARKNRRNHMPQCSLEHSPNPLNALNECKSEMKSCNVLISSQNNYVNSQNNILNSTRDIYIRYLKLLSSREWTSVIHQIYSTTPVAVVLIIQGLGSLNTI
jgi:hypothetical protein